MNMAVSILMGCNLWNTCLMVYGFLRYCHKDTGLQSSLLNITMNRPTIQQVLIFVLSQISEKYWEVLGNHSLWGDSRMGGRVQHVQKKEEEVINTDHGCFLHERSAWGSPSVLLTKQQWTLPGFLPEYKEEVCTIKRGGFACLYACWLLQFLWKQHLVWIRTAFWIPSQGLPAKEVCQGKWLMTVGQTSWKLSSVSELKELISKLDQNKIHQDMAYRGVK